MVPDEGQVVVLRALSSHDESTNTITGTLLAAETTPPSLWITTTAHHVHARSYFALAPSPQAQA